MAHDHETRKRLKAEAVLEICECGGAAIIFRCEDGREVALQVDSFDEQGLSEDSRLSVIEVKPPTI